jgi:hypothetical protein
MLAGSAGLDAVVGEVGNGDRALYIHFARKTIRLSPEA